MISAWDVYWVMQLDSIIRMFVIICIGSGLTTFFNVIWNSIEDDNLYLYRYTAPLFFVALFIAGFLPSSKTAAAMIILPALTDEAVMSQVTKESGEIYQLAKSALREVVLSKKEEKPEK